MNVKWFCQHCLTPIGAEEGDGWIQCTPDNMTASWPIEWEVTCRRCDTQPHATYIIDAVRIHNVDGDDGLTEFTDHLDRKMWANPQQWRRIVNTYAVIG